MRAVLLFAIIAILISNIAVAQSGDRAGLERDIRAQFVELKSTEQEFLAPSAEDRQKYSAFLEQSDTGLTRLLPREVFSDKLTIVGGGAYFSFARLTHEYGYGSDIELSSSELKVGFAGADFGFLASVGKVDLEGVSIDHPAAAFLATFEAPAEEAEARSQYRRAAGGFQANGFNYSSRVRVKKKRTYLLRSISYGGSDLLVAFRVIRQDADGSVVLLWKILKRSPVPELKRSQSSS